VSVASKLGSMPTRQQVIDDLGLQGRAATTALSAATDEWLVSILHSATDDLHHLSAALN
jgi:hypothetical protein